MTIQETKFDKACLKLDKQIQANLTKIFSNKKTAQIYLYHLFVITPLSINAYISNKKIIRKKLLSENIIKSSVLNHKKQRNKQLYIKTFNKALFNAFNQNFNFYRIADKRSLKDKLSSFLLKKEDNKKDIYLSNLKKELTR